MGGNILHPGPVSCGAGADLRQFPANILAPVEGFLVGIHILVGAAEKSQEICIPLRIEHCETFGYRQFRIRMDRMTVFPQDSFLQMSARPGNVLLVCPVHNGQEFVSADPENFIRAENLRQGICCLDNDSVTGLVSAEVIDLFQVIDIEYADGEGGAAVQDLPVQLLHRFQVRVPVTDAGHQITLCLCLRVKNVFLQPVLGFLQLLPDGFNIRLFGGRVVRIRPGFPVAAQTDLARQMLHVFPQFSGVPVDLPQPFLQPA